MNALGTRFIFLFFYKLCFIFMFLSGNVYAQSPHYKLGFTRNQDIEVKKEEYLPLYPWAGGINSVYLSQIDLNLDGILDFIAFEKHGNKILPFINQGTQTNPLFIYAPEYKYSFPYLHDWVILKDFNKDGKADIFTYGLGGIRVFENTSNQKLDFKLVADPINSFQYNNEVNVYASPDDYLGIADLTGNGKLDILNFWILGKFVHFQKNISQGGEFFKYTLADECWGKFSEAADNNEITLFSNCNQKLDMETPKHTGSSIFLLDYNADGLMDVVIGDVDFPGLKLLLNGGTKEEALMVSQTENFPNQQNPVYLYSMPAVATMDFWNVNKPDLFVSPSDPSLTKSEDQNSVWHYHFDEQLNNYVLKTKAYLQEDMIDVGSGSVPILFDWSGTGILDLFIANYGSFDSARYEMGVLKSFFSSSITYYKNVGTNSQPKFEWITSDFGDLKKYGFLALYPTFADLNGDGKIDLLCGNSDGSLMFFENASPFGKLPQFKTPVKNYQNIKVDVFSTPQLFDIQKNGKFDLIIGNRRGTVAYYQNMGSNQNPNFQFVTSSLGNVDVRDLNISSFGYSTPHFFRYQEETLLLCGNEQGDLSLFSHIDNNLEGSFNFLEKITETIQSRSYKLSEGIRVAAAIADINGDNIPDLFIGNWAGGITYFNGSEPQETKIAELGQDEIIAYPSPTAGNLQISSSGLPIESIDVFDIWSRKLLSIHLIPSTSHYQIDLSSLAAGIYFIEISTQIEKIMKKVIKN